MTSQFFLPPSAPIPVSPIITSTTTHFMIHIRFISIHKLLYFTLIFYFLLHNISERWHCHIYQCARFLFLSFVSFFLIIIMVYLV
jgi:hypothetical protein